MLGVHQARDSGEFSRTEGLSAGTRGSDALIAVGASVGSGPRRGTDLARPCQEAGRNLLTGGDSLVNMIGCWLPCPAAVRSRARRPTWRVAMGIYPVTAIEPGAVAVTGGEHSLGFGRVCLTRNICG